MRRKLLLLNLALLALVSAAGWQLRLRWLDGKAQERRVFQPASKPAAPPADRLLQAPQPASAGGYIEVAQKVLFAEDRNPNVVVEAAAPKPVPPLPVAYGVMSFGDAPVLIMSEKTGVPSRGYSVGEKVGVFTLAAMTGDEVVFEWEDRKITRKLRELTPVTKPESSEATATPATTAAAPVQSASASVENGPGMQLTGDLKACVQGDTTAPGTVRDGYRKVVTQTPFGASCRWELVK